MVVEISCPSITKMSEEKLYNYNFVLNNKSSKKLRNIEIKNWRYSFFGSLKFGGKRLIN